MSREDFMKKLILLLKDVSEEEREDAIKFYETYFEDAGKENEEQVLKELGSPEQVAAIIKTNLADNEKSDSGIFTERGYEDPRFQKDKFEVTDQKKQTQQAEENKSQTGSYQESSDQSFTKNKTYQGQNGPSIESNHFTIPILILICIFAIPVGIPVFAVIFSLFISVFAIGLSLFLGFGAGALICILVGFSLAVGGILKIILFPSFGLAMLGGGLLTFGIGVFLGIAAILSFQLIPLTWKGFLFLCRLPFQNRRKMA